MTNLSWTYDSAIAAVALISAGEKAQAEQLLDQLAALQHSDKLDRLRLQRRQRREPAAVCDTGRSR